MQSLRRLMYGGVVQRKSRTRFEFKYIPRTGKQTGKEAYRVTAPATAKSGRVSRPVWSILFGVLGVGPFEMMFLFVLVVAGGVVLGGALGVMQIIRGYYNAYA